MREELQRALRLPHLPDTEVIVHSTTATATASSSAQWPVRDRALGRAPPAPGAGARPRRHPPALPRACTRPALVRLEVKALLAALPECAPDPDGLVQAFTSGARPTPTRCSKACAACRPDTCSRSRPTAAKPHPLLGLGVPDAGAPAPFASLTRRLTNRARCSMRCGCSSAPTCRSVRTSVADWIPPASWRSCASRHRLGAHLLGHLRRRRIRRARAAADDGPAPGHRTHHRALHPPRHRRGLPALVRHTEAPVLHGPVPLMLLGEVPSGYVVLTGEGADEVFAGYDLFKEAKVRWFGRAARLGLAPTAARPPVRLPAAPPVGGPLPARSSPRADISGAWFAHVLRWATSARALAFLSPDLRQRAMAFDPCLPGTPAAAGRGALGAVARPVRRRSR